MDKKSEAKQLRQSGESKASKVSKMSKMSKISLRKRFQDPSAMEEIGK